MLQWFNATIVGVIFLYIIRRFVKRKRPIGELPKNHRRITGKDSTSFPSGHSVRNFIMALILGKNFPKLKFPLFIFATLNSFSRVILGFHYPLDTIVGGILGIIISKTDS
jgi:undecaprenyl-diphosphatase